MNGYYRELNVFYKQKDLPGSSRFYFTKLILSRAVCDAYHYLDRDDKIQIWFKNLRNEMDMVDFLNRLDVKYDFESYNRNHILELIQPASKAVMENLGFYIEDNYSLMYYIHTILTSLFMDWEEQLEFFKYMVRQSGESIKKYKEKEKKTGKKILARKR
ncbi:hypothetical protein [Neomegalonema sp.]|uniref:hypothetical protein n=1 Tax=Neomegalonema sp. TaxID=2039713 RepID=UPI00262FC60A|nr:hypothetical protein [Neomegalonema sp.]MDD2869678.1 hypothetical protein [Neomegalonema sp.]